MILIEVTELDSGDTQYVNIDSIDRIVPTVKHSSSGVAIHATYLSGPTNNGGIYVEEHISKIFELIRLSYHADVRSYCRGKENLWRKNEYHEGIK